MGATCSGLKPHKRDKTDLLGLEHDPPISHDASTTQPPDHFLPKIKLEDVRCHDSPRPSDIGRKLLLPSISEQNPPNFSHRNSLKTESMVQNHSEDAAPFLGNIHNENQLFLLQDTPSTNKLVHLQDTHSTSANQLPHLQDYPSNSAKHLPCLQDNPSTSANQLPRLQDTASTSANQLPHLQDNPSNSANHLLCLQDNPSTSANQLPHLQDTPSISANQLVCLEDTPSPLTYLYNRSTFTWNEMTPSPLTYLYDQRRRRPLLLNTTGLDRQLTPLPSTYLYDIVKSAPEQEIRKLGSQLLHLKDEVENLCGKTCAEYMAFLRYGGSSWASLDAVIISTSFLNLISYNREDVVHEMR